MIPLVSIVVVNYNYARFLAECVESLLSQNFEHFEVVLVDDGSTDNSLEIASKYKKNIKLIAQRNAGVNSARNNGIHHAKGKYIALCDSDDYWLPAKISKQIEILERNADLSLVYCSVTQVKETGEFIKNIDANFSGDLTEAFIRYPSKALIINGPSTSIFDRQKAISVGLFDANLTGNGEDWDFFRRICKLGPVDYVSEPLARIRVHGSNRGAVSLEKYYADNLIAIRKMFLESDYNWSKRKRSDVLIRHEIQLLKSYTKTLSLKGVTSHIRNIVRILINEFN